MCPLNDVRASSSVSQLNPGPLHQKDRWGGLVDSAGRCLSLVLTSSQDRRKERPGRAGLRVSGSTGCPAVILQRSWNQSPCSALPGPSRSAFLALPLRQWCCRSLSQPGPPRNMLPASGASGPYLPGGTAGTLICSYVFW